MIVYSRLRVDEVATRAIPFLLIIESIVDSVDAQKFKSNCHLATGSLFLMYASMLGKQNSPNTSC